jgi:hypothetical protein
MGCLCLASQRSHMFMSLSIISQERSSSTRVLAVSKIVLNKVNEMLVWSSRPFPILGCLVTGTVMEKISQRVIRQNKKMKYNRDTINQRDMEDLPSMVAK